jgi:ribonuclease HII
MLKNSYKTGIVEAGCDEAGRGCLAGPVVAAAVVLPPWYANPLLNDSKKLTAPVRELLRSEIEQYALSWAVGYAGNEEIDQINILRASLLAMHRALSGLTTRPAHILVDGNFFISFQDIPHTCIVRGDSIYASIAAASILAKTHRDELMCRLHGEFPVYGWNRNKGYATEFHAAALQNYGPCPLHRKSFRLSYMQPGLEFETDDRETAASSNN